MYAGKHIFIYMYRNQDKILIFGNITTLKTTQGGHGEKLDNSEVKVHYYPSMTSQGLQAVVMH